MGSVHKIIHQNIDGRILVLAALAVAGLYVCLWLIGSAVWDLSAKIDALTQALNQ